MINKVKTYLDDYSIKNCDIIVGLSGGPDSVFLLSVLNSLKIDYNLVIKAAYVNHGIRSEEENYKDHLLVEKLCKSLNVKLNICNIPYNQIINESSDKNCSVEAIAREYRYNFFNSLVTNGDYIAVGHNCDDQKETQIMRFFQGSSIEGLLGIKSKRNNIIRPIIDIEKKQILLYLELNSIKYNIDYTNNQLDYLRNNVRHIILPKVEKVFPSYRKALKNIENELLEYKQIVDSLFVPLEWEKHKDFYITNYQNFIELPFLKRKEEIYRIFDLSFKGNIQSFRLPKRFLESLKKNTYNNNEIILDGYGFNFIRNGKKLVWKSIRDKDIFFKIYIESLGNYTNSHNSITISSDKGDLHLLGLTFPFSIRSYTLGYPEVKILKKHNKTLHNYNEIFIVEKDNDVYAIIQDKKIIYIKSNKKDGLYIDIF